MKAINVVPIVEGHGDNDAVRTLIERLWRFLGGDYCNVLTPIRRSRGKLLKENDPDLANAINTALIKLGPQGGLVLLLIDAEDDCRKFGPLGPLLLRRARDIRGDADLACVIANVMYETWFVASAESLGKYLLVPDGDKIPDDPEADRAGKGWIKKRIRATKYSETIDQPRLTAALDLALCRSRSRSFDKLCRELEKRISIRTSEP